jgi:hypothetical protein
MHVLAKIEIGRFSENFGYDGGIRGSRAAFHLRGEGKMINDDDQAGSERRCGGRNITFHGNGPAQAQYMGNYTTNPILPPAPPQLPGTFTNPLGTSFNSPRPYMAREIFS